MKVIMTQTMAGASNEHGSESRIYKAGEEIVPDQPWKQALAHNFLSAGVAREVKVIAPSETKTKSRKRARNDDGTLKGDDPSTPNVNEAWEDDSR